MKTLLLILLLAFATFAQPNLDEYTVVAKTDVTAYSLKNGSVSLSTSPTFVLLMARISGYKPGEYIAFDPTNYVEFKVRANCPKKNYQILSGSGQVNGKPYTSKIGNIVHPQKGNPMFTVLREVCKDNSLSI